MTPTTQQTNPGAGGSYLRLPDGTLERRTEAAPAAVDRAAEPAVPNSEATAIPARKD